MGAIAASYAKPTYVGDIFFPPHLWDEQAEGANTMDDEQLLLRCQCGGFHFLEVGIFYDGEANWRKKEDTIYFVTFAQEPRTFWRKLKALFRHDNYAREVLLTESQMREIKNILVKHLGA